MIPWHRLLGIALDDLFYGTAYEVETEIDLSQKRQLLDIVVIRRGGGTRLPNLPAGLENLADHNLITFKSIAEPLAPWHVHELTSHYVSYRKQISPSPKELLPQERFKLIAVCVHYPRGLAKALPPDHVTKQADGVYAILWGDMEIPLLVLREIPRSTVNALWNLFSGVPEKVVYGQEHYQWHDPEHATITELLYSLYREENANMPYTVQDFKHDAALELLPHLTVEERLKGLDPKQRLEGLDPKQRLEGLDPKQLLENLDPEQLRMLEKLFKQAPPKSNGGS